MIELQETHFDGSTVELTYSDEALGLHSDHFLKIRMPMVGDHLHSVAWHRLTTLQQAQDVIAAEIQRLRPLVDREA